MIRLISRVVPRSIASQALLAIAVATVLPMLVGLVRTQREAATMEAVAFGRMQIAAKAAADRLEETVRDGIATAQTIEHLPTFWDGTDTDRDVLLHALGEPERAFNGLTYLDDTFMARGSSVLGPDQRRRMEQPYLKQALGQQTVTFAPEARSSMANGAMVLPMAVPIHDLRDGSRKGLLLVSLKLLELPGVTDSVGLPASGGVLLVDRRGNVVVGASISTLDMLGKVLPAIDSEPQRTVVGERELLMTERRLADSPWSIVVAAPSETIFAPIYRDASSSTGMTLLTGMGALLLLFSVWRRLSRGVDRLQTAAKAWSRGELDYRAETSAGDELAHLGVDFNRMAAELKETVDQLTAQALLLDLAHDAIIVRDGPTGAILYWNRGAEQMYGWSRDEVMGQDLEAILKSQFAVDQAEVTQAFEARGHWQGELIESRRDGSEIAVATRWARHADDNGNLLATLIINTDITERRAVNKLKDEFVSIVSHELRTPLTSIRGSLGLLAGGLLGELPAKGQRLLDIAVSNTDRLIRLINDILDIERMDSGVVQMDKRACDVDDLLTQTVDLMRAMADDASVELVLDSTRARLWADSDRLLQMLSNLVSNAIKFSDAGTKVALEAVDRGDTVLISVTDQGRGIPADKLEAVFERFHQVDASDSREKGGTGLGLAICRTIVQQHDGRIWVESGVGEGSTFFVELPILRSLEQPDVVDESLPLVLLCDDEPAILEVVGTMLQQRGYRVRAVRSGQEAIDSASEEAPAAIVLDLVMPGLSGWATLAELQRRPETRDVPVIIFSAVPPIGHEVTLTGVMDWLAKPLDGSHLVRALDKVTGRIRRPRALVVEDDADLARVLLTMCERQEIDTLYAPTGQVAIDLGRRHDFDLLLLDLMLPECDGFAVVEQLRDEERLRHVPVVVYTARDLDAHERQRLRLGHTEFLTKGRISPARLEERLAAVTRASALSESA